MTNSLLPGYHRRPAEDDLPEDFAESVDVSSPLPRLFTQIRDLDQDELVALRQFITSIVPVPQVDVRAELTFQLMAAQQLQSDVLVGRANPTQKGSALRVVNSVLKQLIDQEAQVYNIARMKALEEALRLTFGQREDGRELKATFESHFHRLTA